MKIPIEFELFGQTVKVKYIKTLTHIHDDVGHAVYRDNEIILQERTPGTPIPRDRQEKTFCHELIHFMFNLLRIDEKLQTEKNIDSFALLLHQFMKTAKYKKKEG